jgi:propanol-preferring alcohol dehydrogenase
MRVMLLDAPGVPLHSAALDIPMPGAGQVRLRVLACGVCRTDLHIADGELASAKLPLVLGHQIVGRVDALPDEPSALRMGDRVGVPWLAGTCGTCRFCADGRENLCALAAFTGYTVDGGFADFAIAQQAYCLPLPEGLGDVETAPLLCAGLIGYRALRMTGEAERLGLFGFGAAGHLVAQIARTQGRQVYAFTRPGDDGAQRLALELGATWAGGSDCEAPDELDAAIIFAPAGELVPVALQAVARGGTVVCGGIHMSDIPSFPYALLWGERSLRSVAHLTRADGREFLNLAARIPLRAEVHRYPLQRAADALDDLRNGRFSGVAVLVP